MSNNLPRVDLVEGIHAVRGDLYRVGGAIGGKARTCWALAQGATGLVTAGSRSSPQANIVASIAQHLGVPCRVHTPQGELSPELLQARRKGAEIIQHKAGYNSVIVSRAREDAKARGWREIPFGMECQEAVKQTSAQVSVIPRNAWRVVIPVGSGMSLAGLLTGLRAAENHIPVVGIKVGADPFKRLDTYAPLFWENQVKLLDAGVDYHAPAAHNHLGGIRLDSHYEAKCLPFLLPNDCFWIVGIRATEAPLNE